MWTASTFNERRTAMLRQLLFLGIGVCALLGMLGAPGQLHAQGSRGGFRQGMQPRVNPNMRHGFTPGFGSPRFNGRSFDPRRNRMRFDRFEDRFESRFGPRRFDRLEDRFENRFRFERFDPRFRGGFFAPRFL
jgi:hypothetical protein